MKKLIIFDCDGVLVDSEIVGNRVYAEMLTSFGYSITTEETIRRFTGIESATAAKIVKEEAGISLPENLMEIVDQAILDALEKELKPLMHPLLNDLHPNINRCVASNSSRKHVLKSLTITNLHTFFKEEHVFTASQVQKGKPAPDLFLFAADQMGFHPKDCIVIEDSIPGIHAARAAEMPVIGFLAGGHTHFNWYQERIRNQNIPTACSSQELITLIQSYQKEEVFI